MVSGFFFTLKQVDSCLSCVFEIELNLPCFIDEYLSLEMQSCVCVSFIVYSNFSLPGVKDHGNKCV